MLQLNEFCILILHFVRVNCDHCSERLAVDVHVSSVQQLLTLLQWMRGPPTGFQFLVHLRRSKEYAETIIHFYRKKVARTKYHTFVYATTQSGFNPILTIF